MPDCRDCGHEMSLSRCWRLTCPSNGAGISSQLVRDRVAYDRAVVACSNAARMAMRSSLFDPEPPEKALAHTMFALPISCSTGLFDDWLGEDDDDA